MALIRCPECKKQVSDQAKSCPHCGMRLKAKKSEKEKSGRGVAIMVTTFTLILAAFVLFWVFGRDMVGKNLSNAYNEYCKGKTSSTTFSCKLSDGGKSLSVDTNPQDKDNWSSLGGSQAVRNINKYMGFPEALNEMIGDTSSLDGRITKEYKGYEITWKYHPDTGLEIIYTKK